MGGRRIEDHVREGYSIIVEQIPKEVSMNRGCFNTAALIIGWIVIISVLFTVCTCTSAVFS